MKNHPTTFFQNNHGYSDVDEQGNSNISFWAYPRMRSFGLDHYQTVSVLSNGVTVNGILSDEMQSQSIEWIQKFHNRLKTRF